MQCPNIASLSYGEFSAALHEKAVHRRTPLAGTIELTSRCNLNCAHCYINEPLGSCQVSQRELSTQQWFHLIDQIVDEGCLWLLLTGGEVLVRPDFRRIYDYAKVKGLLVTLFTNGTLITRGLADHLAEWRPFAIEVTLYGRTRLTYEMVTRAAGSYDNCIRGIELLVERGLPLRLKAMVTTQNRHELREMKAYANQLGLDFGFDTDVNPRLNGDRTPLRYRLEPEEVLALDFEDARRREYFRKLCSHAAQWNQRSDSIYQCGVGTTDFFIDPYGNLRACMMTRTPGFDLTSGAFRDGWSDVLPLLVSQPPRKQSPCRTCRIRFICGQCPSWGEMENGDSEAPVEYLCRIAHLRAEAFGFTASREVQSDV